MPSFRNFFSTLGSKLSPRRDRTIKETTEEPTGDLLQRLTRDPRYRERALQGDLSLLGDIAEGLSSDEIYQLETELQKRRGTGGAENNFIEENQVQDVVRSMRLNPNSRVGRIAEQVVDFWRGVQGFFRKDRHDELAREISRAIEKSTPDFRERTPTPVRRIQTSQGIDSMINDSRERMGQLASRLRSGQISVDQFRSGMSSELRRLGLASLILGVGGPGNLTGHHTELLDRYLARQLSYLGRFVEDLRAAIASGHSMTAREITRATLYASSARPLYEEAYRQQMVNRLPEAMERRVLHAGESCPGCVEQAALGWQPIGTLEAIGSQECGQFCKCQFEYNLGGESSSEAGEAV